LITEILLIGLNQGERMNQNMEGIS
jgi:hypothetical protein